MTQAIDTTAVAVRENGAAVRSVRAEDFMPVLSVQQAVQRKEMMTQFIGQVMREGEDYGKIPGAGEKKVLLKAGAEKLSSIFGLSPRYEPVQVIEDFTGKDLGGEPLFYYEYKCTLYRGDRLAGEGIGSCNSWESRYRYRWVPPEVAALHHADYQKLPKRGGSRVIFEPNFALEKRETAGKYGKPAEYWHEWEAAILSAKATRARKKMGAREYDGWQREVDETQYRIPNPDVADVINTCQKMAQKRALVAAVLVVTNCSDAFTQDVEDFAEEPPRPGEPHEEVHNRRIDEESAKLDAQRPPAQEPQRLAQSKPALTNASKPAPEPPARPWDTFKGMVAAFEDLKQRLAPYTAPYYACLVRYGVKHANEFKPSSLGVSDDEARQRAADCYRELLAKVAEYEAIKDTPATNAFDEHMASMSNHEAPLETSREPDRQQKAVPSLYVLEDTLLQLIAMREDAETDEERAVIDQQLVEWTAHEVLKVENIHGFLRHCELMEFGCAQEEDRIRELKHLWKARADRVKELVRTAMEAAGKKKLEGRTGSLVLKANGGRQAVLIPDPAMVPDEYCTFNVTLTAEQWREVAYYVDTQAKREPAKPEIYKALTTECNSCGGSGQAKSGNGERLACPTCGGSGKAGVQGCSLADRGSHVEVR